MTDKEVMQMALDALSEPTPGVRTDFSDALVYREKIKATAEALRAALAQPEPKNDEYCPACDGDYCIAKKGCVALIKPPQPEPEPVAWTVSGLITDFSRDFSAYKTKTYTRPLYTAPPQREWVGLTDEEVKKIYTATEIKVDENWRTGDKSMMFPTTLYEAIEAKLKEKNT